MKKQGTSLLLAGALALLLGPTTTGCDREAPQRQRLLGFGSAEDRENSSFSTTPASDRGLLWFEHGWSKPEDDGVVWAVGPRSDLRIWIEGENAVLQLLVQTSPELYRRGQELVVLLNGVTLDTLRLADRWETVQVDIALSPEAIRPALNELSFVPSVHREPAATGDQRRHSFRLHTLSLSADVTSREFAVYDLAQPPLPDAYDEVPPPPRSHSPRSRDDVLMILLDAARADHVGAYGYARETTPFIDSLADEGLLFPSAYSTASYTRAAIASLFTGRSWTRHGVLAGEHALDDEFVTLAEVFRSNGYATYGTSACPNASVAAGSAQGFDEWIDIWPHPRRENEGPFELPVTLTEERLVEGFGDQPVFAYVHLLLPHEPYSPGPEYDLWPVEGASPWVNGKLRSILRMNDLRGEWSEADRQRMASLYDGNLRKADAYVQRLVEAWKARREGQPRVVILSDHGEALGEHDTFGHNLTAYDEMTHIPLILWPAEAFGALSARREDLISIEDVFPMLVRSESLQLAAGSSWPRHFVQALERRRPQRPHVVIRSAGTQHALRLQDGLLVHDGWSLQEWSRDRSPGENRRGLDPAGYRLHASELFTIVHSHDVVPATVEALPEADAEALRTLGYQ